MSLYTIAMTLLLLFPWSLVLIPLAGAVAHRGRRRVRVKAM